MIFVSKQMSFSYLPLQRNVGKPDGDPVSSLTFSSCECVWVCVCVCVCMRLWAQSCPTLCNPTDCSPPGSSIHGIFSGTNAGVGCHFLLQGIFPTQGSNPHLLGLLCWQVHFLSTGPPEPWAKPNSQHLSTLLLPTRGKRDIINTEGNAIIQVDSLSFPENYSHKVTMTVPSHSFYC